MPPKTRKKIETEPKPETEDPNAGSGTPGPGPGPGAGPILDDNTAVPKPKAPRKGKQSKKEEKNIEHIIVQLPILQDKLEDIIQQSAYSEGQMVNDNREPLPYSSVDHFDNIHDCISEAGQAVDCKNVESTMKDMHPSLMMRQACYWCCHEIGPFKYGMPISYDPVHHSFHQYGQFCSLECTSAYNYSVNMGSDRMWEINSWIQLMAKKLGIELPIRAAPSRYMLQMFGGPLRIEDFRACHKSLYRAYVMNIPPMINVSAQSEVMNVSYIYGKQNEQSQEESKTKLARKKSIMDSKKTLDSKMNLTYENIQVDDEA